MYGKRKSMKSGFAKYFRNADAPWSWCIGGLIGGFVLSDIGFVICNSAGFNEIFKNGAVVVRNPLFWIGLGLNFVFNVVFYLSLTCVVSKINPPVRRHGILMKCLAVLSWIVAYCVYTAFRSVCAALLEGTNHFSIWYFLFLYEICRGLWRWIVGVKDKMNVVSRWNNDSPDATTTNVQEQTQSVRDEGAERKTLKPCKTTDGEDRQYATAIGGWLLALLLIGLAVAILWGNLNTDQSDLDNERQRFEENCDSDSHIGEQQVAPSRNNKGCSYSRQEMLDHYEKGIDYSDEELAAMTKVQAYEYYIIGAIHYYDDQPDNSAEAIKALIKQFSKRELECFLRRYEICADLVVKCVSIMNKTRYSAERTREYERASIYLEALENATTLENTSVAVMPVEAFESMCMEINQMYRKCCQKSK